MINLSYKSRIKDFHNKMNNQFGFKILNILNGQVMYEVFQTNKLLEKGEHIPFNEAMCSHDTSVAIFSDEFINLRALGHKVSIQEYKNLTMTPLKPLFEKEYKCIVLWFGDDMFCQINMLTVLAYLEQVAYKGKVFFNMVNEMTFEIETTEIFLSSYKKVYQQVLINHQFPNIKVIPSMFQGIRLYMEYIKVDNEIVAYIRENEDLPQNKLLDNLFQSFPQYGLGDVQYLKIIETISKV
ncbi:AraC family transcriptional regulator [Priestia megaterium]|uniref:AraC family transcriptional regulator n=2 Tax=Priestia megaterium TaxID=1404 RepID=UPI000BF28DF6|nr:AraC family transcriptional regulator [Priestia megaterium]PFP09331.1 AraC family transcriptional regulator [Priestia megaterium]PFU63483.1 AraC family transcriptional regulator [Priestia megaterium]QDZ88437.1 AraC family transcriptional regulator [Priestia megaterium]